MNVLATKIKELLTSKKTEEQREELIDEINNKIIEIPEIADVMAELLSLEVNPHRQIKIEITTRDFFKSQNNTSEYIIKR